MGVRRGASLVKLAFCGEGPSLAAGAEAQLPILPQRCQRCGSVALPGQACSGVHKGPTLAEELAR